MTTMATTAPAAGLVRDLGDGWRRFSRNRLAVVGAAIVLTMIALAIAAPLIAPEGYDHQVYENAYLFPSLEHLMGTDGLGREVWVRVLYGAQVSLFVGIVSQLWAFLFGVTIGSIAGYLGGRADYVLMRLVDATAAFPSLLFAILIIAVMGSGIWPMLIAISLTNWVTTARLTRAQFLQLRETEFITAARVIGLTDRRIVTHHLFPNSASPLIVGLTLGIPAAIFTEAGLSFLGLGISPPVPSWGQMVSEGYQYLGYYWYLAVFPALALALLMLGFTWAGDGLRDALDPHEGG
jgi:ABC-type dipeptide/oligopeptide/nickel transport system permease subunit